LCYEDKYHSSEFIRKNGHIWVGKFISENLKVIDNEQASIDNSGGENNRDVHVYKCVYIIEFRLFICTHKCKYIFVSYVYICIYKLIIFATN
jgi:hypothetical protein